MKYYIFVNCKFIECDECFFNSFINKLKKVFSIHIYDKYKNLIHFDEIKYYDKVYFCISNYDDIDHWYDVRLVARIVLNAA